MRMQRYHARRQAALHRPLPQDGEQVEMAAVHAVEHADGERRVFP
jgi:hypothetical protein